MLCSIPMNYKLKKEEINALVESTTYDQARALFRRTYYGRKYEHLEAHNLEEFYNVMLRDTLEKEARRDTLLCSSPLFLSVS